MKIIFPKITILHRLPLPIRFFPYGLTGFRCQSPKAVDIELSNRCNLRCRMCWFHGERGIGDLYSDEELTTGEVFKIIDQLSGRKPSIYIGGSEPLIRKDFLEILKYIKGHNLAVSFTTNGTLLDLTKIEMLVELGVETVNFSIDGPEALHDQVRGEGVYRKVTSAIRELSTQKKSKSKSKPIININITISSSIMGHIEKALNELRDATDDGADFYRLHHLWYVTPGELAAHQSVMKQALGCNAPGAAGHVIPVSEIVDPTAVAEEISALRSRKKVKIFPNLQHDHIIKYYSHNQIVKERCVAPFFSAVIKPNGDLRFCPDEWIDDYVLGNLKKESFDKIWNNEKARRFRSVLWKEKCFPACKRCSWMYSF